MNGARIIRLILYLIRNGRLRHSGYDFAKARGELLAGVTGFSQAGVTPRAGKYSSWPSPLRALASEAAFFRQRLRRQGGHLTLADGRWCYVRVPKAASTSLCGAVLHQRFPQLDVSALSAEQINAMTDQLLTKSAPAPDQDVFTIVRNPFERIVSVYREFFERRSGHFLYEDYLFGILRPEFTFREFVKAITMIPDTLKDQHFLPQHGLTAFYERKGYVKIVRLEDHDLLREFLLARGLKMGRLNAGETYDYRDYYDRGTLEMVNSVYKQDIAHFGYDKEYRALKSIAGHRHVQN